MKTFLTLIFVLAISVTVYAQSDTTHITLEGVLDKTVDRICGGLGEFADQSGVAIEIAWPYAVKYVGAKVTTYFVLSCMSFIIPIFLLGLAVIGIKKQWNDEPLTFLWVVGSAALIACVIFIFCTIGDFIVFKMAPEAATVEYLMKLI